VRYRALGLAPAAADRLARAPWHSAFDTAAPPAGDPARRLAACLAKRIPYHLRRGRPLPPELGATLARVVTAIRGAEVRPEALDRLVDVALERPGAAPDDLLAPFRATLPSQDTVLDEAAARARALPGRSPGAQLRWAMGEAMRALLGRADPGAVQAQLARRLLPPAAAARIAS
jgi:hypothetical protein